MDAREFFCSVRDAVQRREDAPLKLQRMREECVLKSRREGARGKGGVTDPSRRIDAYLDAVGEMERDGREDELLIERGRLVLMTLSKVDSVGATVLTERYINLAPWHEIARALGMERDAVRLRESVAFDRIDSEGLAAMGLDELWATVAEG